MNWKSLKSKASKPWKRRAKSNRRMSGWTFFAGLGVGAAIGMVIAPKSGAELRDDLQDFARDSFEHGRERLHESIVPVIAEARERIEPVVDSVSESVEEATSRAARFRNRVADKAADLKEKVLHGGLLAILNEWPHQRLIEINGIGPVLASKIIQHRPYESEEELLTAKYLPPSAIESLRKAA
jgi:gas vesicle protein